MKLLAAINLVMPKLGERPLTSLTAKHPTLAIILPVVEANLDRCLNKGWWFNEFDYTAMPGTSGEIAMGADVLSFVPNSSDVAVMRGRRLYNPVTLSYVFTEPIKGRIRQRVLFDELPESAASYVFFASLVEAYATDLGVTQELQVWQTMSGAAYSDMLGEHLRQKKHNTRKNGNWRRMIRMMQG